MAASSIDAIFDIAIVGRGVAGCAAALSLADSGQSVAILGPPEQNSERIGEFLSPAANFLLRQLGLADAFRAGPHRPANVVFSAWGSDLLAQRNAIVHLDGPGHVLDRVAFQRTLSDGACCTGATVLSGLLAEADYDGGAWSLRLRDRSSIATRFVLDCSGRAAVIGRRFANRARSDTLIAAASFLTRRSDTVQPTPATLIESAPEGWWYANLLPDQRLVLALFGDPDTLPRHISSDVSIWRKAIQSTQNVRRWVESAEFDIAAPPSLASAGTVLLDPVAGPGWAAAGDAAAAFDPLSSHGLTTALWSGRRAALAAAAAISGDPTPLTQYVATMQHSGRSFLTQQQAVYGKERRWPTLPFWQRRKAKGA